MTQPFASSVPALVSYSPRWRWGHKHVVAEMLQWSGWTASTRGRVARDDKEEDGSGNGYDNDGGGGGNNGYDNDEIWMTTTTIPIAMRRT